MSIFQSMFLKNASIINLICFKEVKISLLGIHSELDGLELHIHKIMSNRCGAKSMLTKKLKEL